MRFLAVLASASVLFTCLSAEAIVEKDKSKKVPSNYDRPATSSSKYSKASYDARPKERYGKSIRSPQRTGVKPAPKKPRRHGLISEGS